MIAKSGKFQYMLFGKNKLLEIEIEGLKLQST